MIGDSGHLLLPSSCAACCRCVLLLRAVAALCVGGGHMGAPTAVQQSVQRFVAALPGPQGLWASLAVGVTTYVAWSRRTVRSNH